MKKGKALVFIKARIERSCGLWSRRDTVGDF